jgi:metal-sulfur cluster biosynthetic enzyme
MVRESLFGLVADTDHDVTIDLTFDPPWIVDMMTEEARLELGL